MRHSVLIPISKTRSERFPDKVIVSLPIDQFPVHASNFNVCGFPNNDIALLRELSAKGGINNSRFEAAAARLNVLRGHDNSKKTLEELWRDWRPSWFQSPTELKLFEEWYLSTYPFEAAVTETEKPVEVVQPVEEKSVETKTD